MRIGIYGRGLANRAGIGRYTRNLLQAMIAAPRGHEILIFTGNPSIGPEFADHIVSLRGPGNRIVEEQITLPIQTRRHALDLYFNPDFTLPFAPTGARCEVVTVHDAAYRRFPMSNGLRSRILLNASMPRTLRRADAVIANSEFTKQEFIDLYKINPSNIHPVLLGLEDRFRHTFVRRLERTVLAVGSIEPRKNLVALAQAVRAAGAALVVAGGDARGADEIRSQISQILEGNVFFLGHVSEEDLITLYSRATVVAYPSLYEGFGFPPLEAMACGTPVIAAQSASIPEVGGDALAYFDPANEDSLTQALKTALDDPIRRQLLIGRGLERAKAFDWPKTARQTLEIMEATVARAARP